MSNWFEALQQLAELRDKGILTDEEFAAEKERVLASRNASTSGQPLREEPEGGKPATRRPIWIALGASALAIGGVLAYLVQSDINSGQFPEGRRAARAAGTPATAAPAALTSTTPLDSFLRFQSAATCEPAGPLAAVLHQLLPAGGRDSENLIALPDLGGTVRRRIEHAQPKVDGPGATVGEIPLTGIWHGLHVTALRAVGWDDTGFTSFQIRISESAEEALPMLKQAGFPLAKIGELKSTFAKDGQGAAAGIEQTPDGSTLTCARGFPQPGANASQDESNTMSAE